MKILTILERIITGKKVKFYEATIVSGNKTGNRVVVLEDLEHPKKPKFIIEASLMNFIRFKKWIDKEAYADYEINKLKTFNTNLGKLPTIHLSTEVEIEKENYKNKYREEEGDDDYDI